jgi:Leucine-rich repeat (LRR) protein
MPLSRSQDWIPRWIPVLLGMAGSAAAIDVYRPRNAQEKGKAAAQVEKKLDSKPEVKSQKKPDAIPTSGQLQPKEQQKPASKAATVESHGNAGDPAKLKEQITQLQKEVASLKLKVATLELEKLGAMVTIDKVKDGKEIATVNVLKKWSGDKDAFQLLKNLPNLEVVYIDNGQVSDAALGPLRDLMGLNALTLMSPQVTDTGLENVKGLTNLTMLFLTSSKVGDKGLANLSGLKNLQVLALSRTGITDAGLDALKNLKSLKSVYVIGTKVTPEAIEKFKQSIPGVAVYR